MRYRIDTDHLVVALPAAGSERRRLTRLAESDAGLQMSAVAWYEFWRGARTQEQLSIARSYFFDDGIVPFPEEIAGIAADVFRGLGSARRGAADVAVGVTCAALEATLFTRNAGDFDGIPHLQVEEPGE